MDIKIPETPAREIGKELSLNAMIDWFNNARKYVNLDLYIHADVLNVLDEYKKDVESTWSDGKYWLYGQITMDADTPITQNLLQSAIDQNIKAIKQMPNSSWEAGLSNIRHLHFTNLLKLLDFYYNKYDEIAHAPR